nr:ABC transporter ATP-binding protein [uncultured Catonella sp.]
MLNVIKDINNMFDNRQKKRVLFLFCVMLIGAFMEVIGVSLMLPILSSIMTPDIINKYEIVKEICNILDIHSHRTFAVVCIIALIIVFMIKNIFLVWQYYMQSKFIYDNQLETQIKIYKSFMRRPYEYFLNAKSGEILKIIQNDVAVTYSLIYILLSMITETVVSIAISITIFIINPAMTISVSIMLALAMLVITRLIKPVLTKKGIEREKHIGIAYKWLLQGISGIKEIKVAGKEKFFEKNYAKSGSIYVGAEKWNAVLGNTPRLLIEVVAICSMLSFIGLSIYLGKDIEVLMPALGALAMAAMKLMPSANRIVTASNQIAFQKPALKKLIRDLEGIDDIISDSKSIEDKNGIVKLKKSIKINNLTYNYPNNKNIFTEANMEIPIGKSVGIIGKSGTGKTTVVDIILGLLSPSEGEVLADDVNVMDNYKGWLNNIGYIPQTIFIMDDSIKANIAFGEDIDDERIWKALRDAKLEEYVKTLPEGLNTGIGERGIRLSGGQRQRIGIARALYMDPDILIFDEATSALDNETESAIMESINQLHGKKTMIIIAHRLQTIENCDIVYKVEDLKIIRAK